MTLLSPGRAVGATVSHEEFDAALAQASANAGVFAKGTTLVVFAQEPMSFHTLTFSVNPDGSFIRQEKSFDNVLKAHRCVRVDRCWGMELGAFGNLKWHRLPAGTVHYRQARDWWATWLDIEWPAGTAFDVAAGADGSQVFTATVPTEDGGIWTSVTTFAGAYAHQRRHDRPPRRRPRADDGHDHDRPDPARAGASAPGAAGRSPGHPCGSHAGPDQQLTAITTLTCGAKTRVSAFFGVGRLL